MVASHGSNLSKGAAILINPSRSYHLREEIIADNGSYILLFITINDFDVILINVYAPNVDTPTFFQRLLTIL